MTTMAQVDAGQVVQVGLPATGRLADGRSVSGYDLLDADTLAAEGWLPVIEDRPDLVDGEQHGAPEYVVEDGQVRAVYPVEPVPEIEPDVRDQVAAVKAELRALTKALDTANVIVAADLEVAVDLGGGSVKP